ncbi:UDP-N-acetylmuramate dehydrogenase [Nostoc sp. PCC 7524]|uniref:FAD-binding protein n=1 Tax=Nostoc sp. (strain ATCC 29411 / PCC 7524) TaxID=28072 RepID=UPI00029F439F|nr:FAD-binding protein [Nostoc sp. PCC 7524]AFY50748.1 UDP-N-acetylmuramate dehydrogenase [Nostoc sp. PCC 7524]
MVKIQSIESNKLSYFHTLHQFDKYAEVTTLEEFCEYYEWAKNNNIKVYILGNGSNTLFTKKRVQSLIIKNKLPKFINTLDDLHLEVSSSVLVMDILKYCQEKYLDSFYYLASVPATVGGALAMNAGRGRKHECTIYDYVESITFLENGCVKTLKNHEVERSYRETIFTGKHDKIILSAVFKFTPLNSKDNLLIERLKWSKENQDHSAPNCGSVFKLSYYPIMKIMKGFSIGEATFSPKTANWIINKSQSSLPILILILIAKILHFLAFKKVKLEIITID